MGASGKRTLGGGGLVSSFMTNVLMKSFLNKANGGLLTSFGIVQRLFNSIFEEVRIPRFFFLFYKRNFFLPSFRVFS